MSLIGKKDMNLLLKAGFSEEDLGLIENGIRGIEIYETPNDYFARELIENACEQGECDLIDEILPEDNQLKEKYDTSRLGLYDNQEYPGNTDWFEEVPQNLREQAEWLRNIKIGKLNIWQRKNKNGSYEWPVKNLKVEIPEDDQDRYNRLSKENQKILWTSYARDVWKNLWVTCAYNLKYISIEETISIKTKKGFDLHALVISADEIRKIGFNALPLEARWITMIYWEKN